MDPNFTNEDMAYTLAHEGKCLYLRKLLKKHRMHVDAISHLLSIACEYGDVDIVEFLIGIRYVRRGGYRKRIGNSPGFRAIETGRLNIVKLLVE